MTSFGEQRLFKDVDGLHGEILAKEPSEFVSHYLFERIPFLFGNDIEAWIGWKTALAAGIEVDARDVVLIGSAALGFSINPKKNYSAFNEMSDIDVGVISPYHFDTAWRYLRQQRTSWLTISRATRHAIEQHRTNLVFAGTIATDQMLSILPFGLAWQKALDRMAQMEPTKGRDVKLRIYRDYDALRHYLAHNIKNLQNSLAGPALDEEAIGEDE